MRERLVHPRLVEALANARVVYLGGARQTGKSTLAKAIAAREHPAGYVSLDDPASRAFAESDPRGFLDDLGTPLVVDEVQLVPDLIPSIKIAVDSDNTRGQYLLTGSANVLTSPKISESLAGRMQIVNLWPFAEAEITASEGRFVDRLLAGDLPRPAPARGLRPSLVQRVLRGGFPEATELEDDRARANWFRSYIRTVTERDVRELANVLRLTEVPDLIALLAARAGQLLNVASISNALGLDARTVRRYVSLLQTMFLIHRIPAYIPRNFAKRLIKAPKLYLLDSGLAAEGLGIDAERLRSHPEVFGTLCENFVATELLKHLSWSEEDPRLYHWRTAGGVEVDFVLETRDGRVVGIEVKAGSAAGRGDFSGLKALREAVGENFVAGLVLYTGEQTLPFGKDMWLVPFSALWES
jgi:predicted AAA+ superfamily ATPase